MANSCIYNTLWGKKNKKQSGGNQNIVSLLENKKYFLMQVFANLIFQLLVTFIIAFKVKTDLLNKPLSFWALVISSFIIIIVLALVPMPPFIKFILFTLFSVCWGLLLSKIKEKVPPSIIQTALLGTLSVFITMFVIGLFLLSIGVKLGFQFGFVLLVLLIFIIITMIVLMIMNKFSTYHKAISIFILMLFSVYIIFDTNTILQRDYYGDFITASLDYYLDILNIFINFVSLQN
jgi:FtsH-binding integral membrane protein